MELHKWKWIVLGAFGCMKKSVNDNIVLDVFINFQNNMYK